MSQQNGRGQIWCAFVNYATHWKRAYGFEVQSYAAINCFDINTMGASVLTLEFLAPNNM